MLGKYLVPFTNCMPEGLAVLGSIFIFVPKSAKLITQPLLSIIIPTYNREKLIATTIQSLMMQDYQNFEIIVVDDGGSDNTEGVVMGFKDRRIRYIKKSNGERAAARNYGARMANGSYFNFFDSDDRAYPNHLAAASEAIHSLGTPEIFHLGYDVKDENGRIEKICNSHPAHLNEILIDGNHLSCNGVFIRKDIANLFPFNEDRQLSASEDYELWLRLASRFTFHGLNVVTSTVYNHDKRSVVMTDVPKLTKRIHLLIKYLMEDKSFVTYYHNKLHLFRSYLDVFVALHVAIAGGSKMQSLSLLRSAFMIHPSVLFSRRFVAALKNILV